MNLRFHLGVFTRNTTFILTEELKWQKNVLNLTEFYCQEGKLISDLFEVTIFPNYCVVLMRNDVESILSEI